MKREKKRMGVRSKTDMNLPTESQGNSVNIKINTGRITHQLNELTRGANMEDLHYQMTGGFSSQLLHGESFYEPSLNQLARTQKIISGFQNCGGAVTIQDGQLQLTGSPSRITSEQIVHKDTAETGVSLRFNQRVEGRVGVAVCVSPLNADDQWEWYSGYTTEIDLVNKRLILNRASRANMHKEIASALYVTEIDEWIALSIRVDKGKITVTVNGNEKIVYNDPFPLPPGHDAMISTVPDVSFRDAWRRTETGRKDIVPFRPNVLLEHGCEEVSYRWKAIRRGEVQANYFLTSEGSWHANSTSQRICYTKGTGEAGINNAGLNRWGINLEAGKDYEGYIRVASSVPTEIHVSLRSADNSTIYARTSFLTKGLSDEYERISFTLRPSAADVNGRFAITLSRPGTITVGYAFLQPGEWGRYKGLQIRKDLANALVDQGVRLLRLNGGMIERPDYRWANMQGPRDKRPPYDGFYDRYCSNGYGVIEHLQFCESADFMPIIGLNLDETPEQVADFIAYCNAPISHPAGQRRASDGHPEPYNIVYYQIANESKMDRHYVDVFKRVALAVWEISPDITLITTGNTYNFRGDEDPVAMSEQLALHLELCEFAHKHNKKLVWDTHAFNTGDDPGQPLLAGGQTLGAIAFSKWLTRLKPELGTVQIGMLEFNAGRFDFLRGLSHALEMNIIHREGEIVQMAAMPNVSQPWGIYQTDWKAVLWTQGNIYYNQNKVWFQPAYYVDQMISNNWAPGVLHAWSDSTPGALDVLATKREDGVLVIRVINLAPHPIAATMELDGFPHETAEVQIEQLLGGLTDYNTLEQPNRVRPTTSNMTIELGNCRFDYLFPALSFSVIVLSGGYH